MSHPPKFTIFAPSFRCKAFSGVLRSSDLIEEVTESIPRAQAEIHTSMRSKAGQRSERSAAMASLTLLLLNPARYTRLTMPVYVCMLRAVNVGGHGKIKMDELRALFTSMKLRG